MEELFLVAGPPWTAAEWWWTVVSARQPQQDGSLGPCRTGITRGKVVGHAMNEGGREVNEAYLVGILGQEHLVGNLVSPE